MDTYKPLLLKSEKVVPSFIRANKLSAIRLHFDSVHHHAKLLFCVSKSHSPLGETFIQKKVNFILCYKLPKIGAVGEKKEPRI